MFIYPPARGQATFGICVFIRFGNSGSFPGQETRVRIQVKPWAHEKLHDVQAGANPTPSLARLGQALPTGLLKPCPWPYPEP